MRTFFLLLFSFLSVFHFAKAQHDSAFLPGWVALQNGDTLRGLVFDVRSKDDKVTYPILFKKSKAAKERRLHRDNILEFAIERELSEQQKKRGVSSHAFFRRFVVEYDASESTDLNKLPARYKPKWKKDTLFLQLMLEGAMSLYKYKTRFHGVHFFVSIQGNTPEELIHGYYRPDPVGSRKEVMHFVNQLEGYFTTHCNSTLSEKPKKFTYDEIKKAVLEFNENCLKSEVGYVFERPKRGVKYAFFLNGGLAQVHPDHKLSQTTPPTLARDFRGLALRVGSELAIVMPYTRDRLLFYPGIHYEALALQTVEYKHERGNGGYTEEKATLHGLAIKGDFRFYLFRKAKVIPYLQGGLSFGVNIANSGNREIVTVNRAGQDVVRTSAPTHLSGENLKLGFRTFNAGLGVKFAESYRLGVQYTTYDNVVNGILFMFPNTFSLSFAKTFGKSKK